MGKPKLLAYTQEALRKEMERFGEPAFRAKQIYAWLMQGEEIENMTNLSRNLRERLQQQYQTGYLTILEKRVSLDGTIKYLLELDDNEAIEAVLMEYEYGKTLCISTQVGCSMGCAFCASGIGGFLRNLEVEELLVQVIAVNKDMGGGRQITNVVLMGTGEPLLNYENVIAFLRRLHEEEGFHMAYRNISLSTCGIVPRMYQLAEEGMPLTLCLSLHSALSEKRMQLMPIEARYPLEEVISAMQHYYEKTKRRLIYEYIMLQGYNMEAQDAAALVTLLRGQNAHINLIPFNGTTGGFQPPTKVEMYAFQNRLTRNGLSVTIRRTLGQDIEGACGQLRAKHQRKQEE